VHSALAHYEAARLPATATVVLTNRQLSPERVLKLVDDRIRGPEDDVASLVTREELEEVTLSYRRIAGFDVETLNRKGGEPQPDFAIFPNLQDGPSALPRPGRGG
jgi:hypothetical protein